MFITKLQLKNFKRFTDLTIDLTPQSDQEIPKLVLLIGANGSGRSCVFDAFEYSQKTEALPNGLAGTGNNQGIMDVPLLQAYYKKSFEDESSIFIEGSEGEYKFEEGKNIIVPQRNECPYKFYGRTAFRYTPKINKTSIGTNFDISSDTDRPNTLIDFDTQRFSTDIDQIFSNFLKEIKTKNYAQENFNTTLNDAFKNIFGNLETSLVYEDFDLPIAGQSVQFWFKKGSSKIPYDHLSAGEKMIFELLVNLYARKEFYQDAIYFFDEIDLHINTTLQYNLLKEIIENWISKESQVWVASHSLGFIDYTREYDKGAIIDFDNLDFDKEQTLKPKDSYEFDVYDVVFGLKNNECKSSFIDYLKNRNQRTFVCEGNDQKYFSELNLSNIEFTDKYGKNKTNKKSVIQISKNEGIFGLIDRDYLTEEEIKKLKKENERLYILDFYCLENYLYHPENILEKNPNLALEKYKQKITELKNQKVNELIVNLSLNRNEYKQLENQEVKIKQLLESDEFNIYYPILNINKIDKSTLIQEFKLKSEEELTQTKWFKSQIEEVLK